MKSLNKSEWKLYKFEDFVENVKEQVTPKQADSEKYIGLEHLDSESLHIRRCGTKISLKGTKLKMKKGDVLFARRNAYLKRVAISPHDGLFSAHGLVFRPISDIVYENFLPFFLLSDIFWDRAIKISVGSLSPTINWGTLRHQEFKLPPLDEQKRIADLLWSVDEVINKYKKLLDEISLTRSSILKDLYKNDNNEVKNIKLSDLPIKKMNGMWKTNEKCNVMYAYIIRSTEIQPYGEISYDTAQKHKVKKAQFVNRRLLRGDIIIERSGGGPDQPVGRVCYFDKDIGDYTFSNFTSVFRVENKKIVLPKYLLNFLLFFYEMKGTDRLQKQTTGIRNLDYELYRNIRIPICDIDRQKKCVEKIELLNKRRKDIENQILYAQRILKQIINKIFG
jgi:type I restriction enzyme, S subunit